ncbi:hybrid sensor histidine kinase/response regulator [Schlesneria paludicola]|uniref:hybrid sensor histidine kinase/response regulator n=1 Tax=Schlesneria paludicola TaxID=360056 RepID=UPI00029A1328|nr:PAS domain S-box protein [Schlesneria paludicola]
MVASFPCDKIDQKLDSRLRTSVNSYGVATAAVGIATSARWLLEPVLKSGAPFSAVLIAVMFVAWYCGARAAVLATVLGFVATLFLFIMPHTSIANDLVPSLGRFAMYFILCSAVIYFFEIMRNAQRRSLASESIARQQAETLRTTFASIGDAVITTDASGKIVLFNPVAERLTGWCSEVATDETLESVFRVLNEITRQPLENPVEVVLREGRTVSRRDHLVLIAADAGEKPIEFSAAPIRGKDGAIVGIAIVFRDVLEIRQALDVRLRLAAIVESTDDAIVSLDLEDKVVSWNEAAERLYGYRAEEMLGKPLTNIVPDDLTDELIVIQQKLRDGDRVNLYETARLRKDGTRIDVSLTISPLRTADGRIVGCSKIARDISQRKRMEQTNRFLADSSAALAVLVDYQSTLQKIASLSVPYFADWATVDLIAADGMLNRVAVAHRDPLLIQEAIEMNRRFPPEPTSSHGVWNIVNSAKGELIAEIDDALIASTTNRPELRDYLTRLGIRSYIGVPLKVRDRILGVIMFFCAESGRRYGEHDLWVANELAQRAAIAIENASLYQNLKEADRRKDEFLAILAHELRNPLAPMRNAIQILHQGADKASVVQYSRDVIDRQIQQMTRLIDDLLDVSRISRNKLELRKEAVTLQNVIECAIEASQPVITESGHKLAVSLPDQPIGLNGDPTRLAQIFLNLLNNAAKYTERGGQIELRARVHGSQIVVNISDNGIGIPADKVPSLFQMFAQVQDSIARSQGGLGIGLSLVKRLVEMHGGTIEASSEGVGQGSRFTVRLPIESAGEGVLGNVPRAPQNSMNSRLRILVVDDNYDAAITLTMLLKSMGNEVRTAHDGEAAVQMAQEFRPEVVLLDIGLPKMNGYEVARAIRGEDWSEHSVLIAVTGWGQEDDKSRAAAAGFDRHLVKPVDPQSLMKILVNLQAAS